MLAVVHAKDALFGVYIVGSGDVYCVNQRTFGHFFQGCKGVWNVMPVQEGDHGAAVGLFADEAKTKGFYIELCEMLNAL